MKVLLIVLLTLLYTTNIYANHSERKVDPFTGVSLRLEATLYVEQSEKHKVEITASTETLERIVTEVKDGLLIIRYNRSGGLFRSVEPGPVSIMISMPEIKQLGLASEGKFFSEKEIEADTIELSVSGGGDMVISGLKTNYLKGALSGSGNIKVIGTKQASQANISVSGSGHFIANQFEVDTIDVRLNGSGDVWLTVHEELKARIIGSGDIRYHGNPNVETTITGSGSVRALD